MYYEVKSRLKFWLKKAGRKNILGYALTLGFIGG
jgi:hypothetical protein